MPVSRHGYEGAFLLRFSPTRGTRPARSAGQKSNGRLEQLFRVPTKALLTAIAKGGLTATDLSGFDDIPFAHYTECGSG